MEKTIFEWLSLIKDNYIRNKAIYYHNKAIIEGNKDRDAKATNFSTSLLNAFNWEKTAEGSNFWHRLYQNNPKLMKEPLNIEYHISLFDKLVESYGKDN